MTRLKIKATLSRNLDPSWAQPEALPTSAQTISFEHHWLVACFGKVKQIAMIRGRARLINK